MNHPLALQDSSAIDCSFTTNTKISTKSVPVEVAVTIVQLACFEVNDQGRSGLLFGNPSDSLCPWSGGCSLFVSIFPKSKWLDIASRLRFVPFDLCSSKMNSSSFDFVAHHELEKVAANDPVKGDGNPLTHDVHAGGRWCFIS